MGIFVQQCRTICAILVEGNVWNICEKWTWIWDSRSLWWCRLTLHFTITIFDVWNIMYLKILWKMEHLLCWSKCSIFHNIFKSIQISTEIFLEFFQYCQKKKRKWWCHNLKIAYGVRGKRVFALFWALALISFSRGEWFVQFGRWHYGEYFEFGPKVQEMLFVHFWWSAFLWNYVDWDRNGSEDVIKRFFIFLVYMHTGGPAASTI